MAMSTSVKPEKATGSDLQELAKRHLWMHFTRMGAYADADVPVIVRGEGCYVWDEHGNRYLDGLSALFCVNVGHGRDRAGRRAARRSSELDFFTIWSYAHPRAIELAARIAELAPGDLNRVFFTTGGSEAVESAIKLARRLPPQAAARARRSSSIAREIAYHGATLGALAATGLPRISGPFEPLVPGGVHVPNTEQPTAGRRTATRSGPPTRSRRGSSFEGPETVAAVILEPLQNAGGCIPAPGRLLPAGPRDLRPPRRAADLRRGDLRLGPPRPLVRLPALRLPARHHHRGQGR